MNNNFLNLTCPQKAILNMEQFYPNTSMNTISGQVSINAPVDIPLLQKSINIFVENTNDIRYRLHIDEDVVTQYEHQYEPFFIEHIELNPKNRREVRNTIARKVFTLYDSPLYYFETFTNPDLTGGFFVCVHHIISDAWSMSMLISSIISIYSQLLQKKDVTIDNSFAYSDFIARENEYLQSKKFSQDEEFWNNLFDENIFEDSFSTNINNSALPCVASRAEFKLSEEMTNKIIAFCKQIKVSPFTFILFAMGIYESKIKQINHLVLSSPILNRSTKQDKQTFGLFVNNMLFKLDIDSNCSFYDSINKVTSSQFSYLRHQKYPLENLITNIKNKYNIKENLYNTSISYQNARANHGSDNVTYSSEWFFSGFSSIPLLLHIYDMDDTNSLSFIYDYQDCVYNYDEIENINNRLLYICEQVMKNPNILIKDIELSTEKEKNLILNTFNKTFVEYDKTKTVLDLWNQQTLLNPNKTAIICGEQTISYSELDKLSNCFAETLQKKHFVTPGHNIAVILDRSIDLAVSLLAILKCGCSYVLVDPSHPSDRQEYMIGNSKSQYVISEFDLCKEFDGNYNKPDISSDFPMYLLYTSGSTGLPKAVTITHKNFHSYLVGISNVVDYSGDKKVLSMASISFDVFGFEFWVTLLNGLTLVLSNRRRTKQFYKIE